MKYAVTLILVLVLGACVHDDQQNGLAKNENVTADRTIRVATFNVSMYRQSQGELITSLSNPDDKQIRAVADIIDIVDPDVLLINEFDYDPKGEALALFQKNYLSNPYPYSYVAPSNTGIASGVDLDNDGYIVTKPGSREYGGDALGYGIFEGQYGFAIVSRYPIDAGRIRTFQNFLWKDMPDNLMPKRWYSQKAQEVLRLSSKNHVDVPVTIGKANVHILAAHPTPPSFDGPEDRNGKRNYDEIRLLADYIGSNSNEYLVDDDGNPGGLGDGKKFVILGDLNADPHDGGSINGAIDQLLDHPRVGRIDPQSEGGAAAAAIAGGGNDDHKTPPAQDTADFRDINDDGTNAIGNLRLDYVLPSNNMTVKDDGVYWPAKGNKGYELVGPGYPPVSSDHRLVWVDLIVE